MSREETQLCHPKEYDRIFRKNMDAALPAILEYLIGIEATRMEALPNPLQHAKERKPDVLKRVTDKQGESFVLQVEFLSESEPEMVYRMGRYFFRLLRTYKLPVKQYVVYISDGPFCMPDQLMLEHLQFHYSSLSLSSVDYHLFLRSEKPETKIMAILANLGDDEPELAVAHIVKQILEASLEKCDIRKYMHQLNALGQLRNSESVKLAVIESLNKVAVNLELPKVDKNMKDHSKDPYFVKKQEEAQERLPKVNKWPEELTGRK